ncbi:hypothetical protein PT286_08640 [Neisseriaceae bacterium ESL0693]|nr:hypothetical protein [Neisseriaceae bacterium ESL0693]
MRKFTYILGCCFLSLSLSGCYYNSKSGCLHLPQSVHCPMKNYKSDVQRYYKIDGQPVSEEQKINDIKACGAVPDKDGNFLRAIRKAYPADGKSLDRGAVITRKIYFCMKEKGYDYDNVYN